MSIDSSLTKKKLSLALSVLLTGVGIYVVSNLVGGSLFYGIQAAINPDDFDTSADIEPASLLVLYSMVTAISLTLVYLAASQLRKLSFKQTLRSLGFTKPSSQTLAYTVIGFGLYFLVAIGTLLVLEWYTLLPEPSEQDIGFNDAAGWSQLAAAYIALAILAPISEEILFRGFMFKRLRKAINIVPAAAIVSVLFGIAHVDFSDIQGSALIFIDTTVLSAAMIYAMVQAKSILPAIAIHAIKNNIAFYALFISDKI